MLDSSCAFTGHRPHKLPWQYNEWEDTIPDEYALQLAHYMAVTGYAGAYIAVLIGGNTFKWKFVERDEELISMLIELESAFWNHVQDCTPPPLDGSDASAKFLHQRCLLLLSGG